MDLVVNVGIGTGRENERAVALQQTLAIQQQDLSLHMGQ